MRRASIVLGVLLALAVIWSAQAQEPVYLRAVEPSEGRPGEELELTLRGGGFGDAQEVRVTIGEIQVMDAWFEPEQQVIRARVHIPEGTPPGPRNVEVVIKRQQNEEFREFGAALEGGFMVLEAQPPRPTEIPATGRPALYGVEPREVQQGSEVELTLFGENLSEETEVLIHDRGVEVREWRFLDPSRLSVRVVVRADAAPGPRLVAVGTADRRAELPDGLVVIERQIVPRPSPTPTRPQGPPDGGPPPWVWAGGALLLLGTGVVIGRALALRTRLTWERAAQLQWEVEAKKELPQPKQACTWACKAGAKADLLNRWHVTALTLTPLPMPEKTPPVKCVAGEPLKPLDEAVRQRLAGGDETRRRIAPVVDALLTQIQSWRAEGQTPASIRVDAEVQGDVKCEFALCHCEQRGAGLEWIERLKWKGTLRQPGGEFLGVLRGPTAGELDLVARAREELEGFLLTLVTGVRFKL